MLIWILFALLTVGTALVLIRPLLRPAGALEGDTAPDQAIYRDQLTELDRDLSGGVISAPEAEAARAEIARRLIAAAAEAPRTAAASGRWGKGTALAVAIFLPVAALAGYLAFGQPGMPDRPLAARLAEKPADGDIMALVGRVERHLEQHPEDIRGWRALAPIYLKMHRYDDAVAAYGRVVDAGGADADAKEGYAMALTGAAGGVVGEKAQKLFAEVVAADPDRASARFYNAEGLRQSGDLADALAAFDDLIHRSPADAPWLEMTRKERRDVLVALGRPADTPEPAPLPALPDLGGANAAASGPSEADVKAAAGMSEGDRSAMISGMVERLAARLDAAPNDLEGWKRLVRAYVVVGKTDDARTALAKARSVFAADAAALADLDATAGDLGFGKP